MSHRYTKIIGKRWINVGKIRKQVTILGVKDNYQGEIEFFSIEFPDGSTVDHTDINELLKLAKVQAEKKFIETTREILVVEVEGNDSSYHGRVADESLSVIYDRATEHTQCDGTIYHTKNGKREYMHIQNDDVVINWTKEREAALKEILRAIVVLRGRLSDVLGSTNQCQTSLDSLDMPKLLAAGKKTKKRKVKT